MLARARRVADVSFMANMEACWIKKVEKTGSDRGIRMISVLVTWNVSGATGKITGDSRHIYLYTRGTP